MGQKRVERRLAAILAADIASYSRLMGADEEGTHAALMALRREVSEPKISQDRGRIVKTTGDGFLAEFASVVDAVRCAVELQREMALRNDDVPSERRIQFRIGINIGDIIIEADDIYGDGVNVAARLETLAEPGGICISAIVHEQVQGRLDCAFTDIGEQSLKNIARPTRVYRIGSKSPLAEAPLHMGKEGVATAGPVLALPDKPSIAVLPFHNLSGDPEQEYFADGMVEEIITALSRIRSLFVIARNSTFTYKGQAIDVKRVGRELGVRYVLEGSVRKAGGRVRITAQLIDAANGTHLWADRFDGSLEDIFALQDRVATSVAGVIEPALQSAEIRLASQRPTADLTAYDLYLRSLPHLGTYEWDPVTRALELLRQATDRDPDFASAWAAAGYCHATLDAIGRVDDRVANRRAGIDCARCALRVAGDDAFALAAVAHVLGYFNEDINTAIAIVDRALAINPSSAVGWRWSAFARLYAGRSDIARAHFETSLRLNPRGPRWVQLTGIGVTYFFERQFNDAVTALSTALQENPAYPLAHRMLAACFAHVGRIDEARDVVSRLRAITPVVIPPDTNYRNPEQRELFLSGLRLAMDERG